MALEQEKRPMPAWLANVTPGSPAGNFTFNAVAGTFVTDHHSKTPVTVVRVKGPSGIYALLFRTALHVDFDGAPQSYAPPISATNHGHQPGFAPLDHINNATNQVPPTFHPLNAADAATNSFEWTGVKSMIPGGATAAGRSIDQRAFLRDVNGKFPLFQRNAIGGLFYYEPQTAFNVASGEAVDAMTVPYAVLSTSLRERGGVSKGDFGLAIRASTGVSSSFLYGDAGGKSSTSVGEASRKLIDNLFGAGVNPNNESICYIVFPGSRQSELYAQPEIADRVVRQLVTPMGQYFPESEDIIRVLANPSKWAHALPTSAADASALEKVYGPERLRIREALSRWGFSPASQIVTNKNMF